VLAILYLQKHNGDALPSNCISLFMFVLATKIVFYISSAAGHG